MGLMEQLTKESNDEKKTEIFHEIRKEIILHSQSEETTFYKLIDERDAESLNHAKSEHSDIKKLLAALTALPISTSKWSEKFNELKSAFEHHVQEEEGKIFEMAKTIISEDEAVELADKIKKAKEELLKDKGFIDKIIEFGEEVVDKVKETAKKAVDSIKS